MSEQKLSEIMSDTTHAVGEAQDALQRAITKAINTHFDMGIQFEQERIIKLLEGTDLLKTIESGAFVNYADTAIELIKGEQK